MEAIFFKTDSCEARPFLLTTLGKFDFGRLGLQFGLESDCITLSGFDLPRSELSPGVSDASWTEVTHLLGVAGTKADPVVVGGIRTSPTGRQLPTTTEDVLTKLFEPFGHIPETLDLVELRNLLMTDLPTRVPCLSNAFASKFSDIFEHCTTEECTRLVAVLIVALDGPRRKEGSSKNALISFWDRVIVELPQLIHEVLNCPISTERNIVDESLPTFMDRRDYLLFLETLPVVFWGREAP